MLSRTALSPVIACVLAACTSLAHSATYYVDASNGNDAWPGRQSSPTGSDGPWQSLARVQSAALLPGDQVLLKCGETWREPLVITRSGTLSQPIVVQSYPSGCADLPLIDGAVPVPAAHWTQHSGAIYRARLPLSVIPNASFDQGVSGWRKWSPTNSASIAESSDCVPPGSRCLLYGSGSSAGVTALSSPRVAIEAQSYTIAFDLKAPLGTSIRVILRRDGAPYEALGFDRKISGTGSWQSYTFTFRGKIKTPSSRLDFEVPSERTISIDNVALSPSMGTPIQAYADARPMLTAHHPNRGRAGAPASVYAANAGDSDQQSFTGGSGSTYINAGADLALPAGATLQPGMNVFVRTVSWLIDQRQLAAVSGSKLSLDSPTSFPLKAGWGYYLTGALWMLDSPGEWHHDPASASAYVWMPDGTAPGDRVLLGQSMVGIDLSKTAYVSVRDIAVRRVSTAVRFANANAVVVSGLNVSDTADVGIDASGSTNSTIENSTLVRTGRDAIAGLDRVSWRMSDGLRVLNNVVSESGVHLLDGAVASLPLRSFAAIHAGRRAYVHGNRLTHSGYIGIWARVNSTVESNYVENACLVLDDCAGIYVGDAVDSVINGNMVVSVPGAIEGKAANQKYTHGVGIYLDDLTHGVVVSNNVVTGADYGIQLHNAYNNTVRDNTIYGNRLHQLWLQETSNRLRQNGDIYGNTITGNVLVPTTAVPALVQSTGYSDVSDFAAYRGNVYSGLLSARMARELWSGRDMLYDFADWRAASTAAGAPRLLDSDGKQITLGGFASLRMTGANIVPNGDLASGSKGWAAWNANPPAGTLSLDACTVGPCLKYALGGAPAVVSSPHFSVVKGQWYRVSFDAMTAVNAQPLRWVVRRGGGGSNGYESLMGGEQRIYGTTEWKRYTYTFQATASVNVLDPVTRDRGARFDFQGDTAGQQFWVANVEVVPAAPVGSELRTKLLWNGKLHAELQDCPDAGGDASFCAKYVRFTDGMPIAWPYSLGGLRGEVIYSRGDTLPDADADGIADSQDACPATPAGRQVNSRGCTIGEAAP